MTTHVDIGQYKSSGQSIGCDRKGEFSFGTGFGRNYIIFGADMSSFVYVDNKKKDILIFGKSPTQGLDGTTLTAEKLYSINFTENDKKFCLRLHYNGANSYLFLNGTYGNMKKTGLNGYFYEFSVDYVAVDDILDILKYLLEKKLMSLCFIPITLQKKMQRQL